ncbi:MAG: glycoside hydrolase family 3 N-terminal domain-containing protein [Bacteroidota bacterium]
MLRPLDDTARAWVAATLDRLTLPERVGHLLMPWVLGGYTARDSKAFDRVAQWVEEDSVGGLLVSVGTPHSYAALTNAAQERATQNGGVPLLVASDMENGTGMRIARSYALPYVLPLGGGTLFPPMMGFGAVRDNPEALVQEMAAALAGEALAVGVHMTFGPVADVNVNPANPIISTRAFGEDPEAVGRLAAAYVRGARQAGLLTCGKHYPGHGDTAEDTHLETPVITHSMDRLEAVELPPFQQVIDAGVDGIMTAHIAVTGVEGADAPPATLSRFFLTEVLRERMGFTGLVFTDALNMGGAAKAYPPGEVGVRAVEAGADVLTFPLNVRATRNAVLAAVASRRLTEERIEASVQRILEAKARAGLHVRDACVSLDAVDRIVATRAHHALAGKAASRAVTLVRDEHGTVPLLAERQRVLSVTYADAEDLPAGNAFDADLAKRHAVTSVRMDARASADEFAALRQQAADADAVVVAIYLSPRNFKGSVGANDRFTAFVNELAGEGDSARPKPFVVVSCGNPYLLSAFPAAPAYLLAWGGDVVCQKAAARALLGTAAITGRLPISLPPFHQRGDGLDREVRQ